MLRSYCEKNPPANTFPPGTVVPGIAAAAVSWLVRPGCGLETMLHWTPSQCRTSVLSWWIFVCSLSYIPTAQTSLGDTAATLRSSFVASAVSLGFGLATWLHRLPSQCKTNVTSAPVEARCVPTAHALVGESAVTESRLLPRAGCGDVTTCQPAPFQCSIRFVPASVPPTAQTSFAPVALIDPR